MKYTLAQRLTQIFENKYPGKDFMSLTTKFDVNYDSMRRVKSGATALGGKSLTNVIKMIPDINLNYLFFEEGDYFRSLNSDKSINGLSSKDIEDLLKTFAGSLQAYSKIDTKSSPVEN